MSEITTVARPYARAIFDLALEKNTLKDWAKALKKLALIASNKAMQPVFGNPLISREQLSEIIIDLARDVLNDESKRLISLLAERKRLNLLPAIEKLYEAFVAERERTIEVKVISAYPIDQVRLLRLQHALQNKLKRQVTLQCLVDNALLGGAVIYAGDQVIDGSLQNKLKRLSERMCS